MKEEEEKTEFDFNRFKSEAMEGLYQGKKMGGTDGIFAPMLKHLLETMPDAELDHHLQESKSSGEANRRNGRSSKRFAAFSRGRWRLRQAGTAVVLSSLRLYPNVS